MSINSRLAVIHASTQKTSQFAVIYKPPGLVLSSHSPSALSLERILASNRPKMHQQFTRTSLTIHSTDQQDGNKQNMLSSSMGTTLSLPFPVKAVFFPHQLDRDAQGLLCVGFQKLVTRELCESIKLRKWRKKYKIIAEVDGKLCDSMKAMGERYRLNGMEGLDLRKGSIRTVLVNRTPSWLRWKKREEERLKLNWMKHVEDGILPEAQIHRQSGHPLLRTERLFASVSEDSAYLKSKDYLDEDNNAGKVAITNYELIDFLQPKELGDRKFALFEVETETGRHHQIRAHFAELGIPIAGDPLYNHFHIDRILKNSKLYDWDIANLTRDQWLHPKLGLGLQASFLEFPDPSNENKKLTVSCELPEEWKIHLK